MTVELSREFLISNARLRELATELLVLIHSHESLCGWLGPYEPEDGGNDFLARYYKEYFEDRIGYLVPSLALLLRILDDRDTIGRHWPWEEEVCLGRILQNGVWAEIGEEVRRASGAATEEVYKLRRRCLRAVLGAVIHGQVVIATADDEWKPERLHSPISGHPGREGRKLSHVFRIVNDKRNKNDPEAIELNLHAFADLLLRIAE